MEMKILSICLKEELRKNKTIAGFETVKGPGIIVKMRR